MLLATAVHDTADLVRAVAWPIIILLLVVALWPTLRLAGQKATERGFRLGLPGGTSFELPGATPTTPTGSFAEALSAPVTSAEFQQAAGSKVQSGVESFKTLLASNAPLDYVELNLREGQSWLTSRLYLASTLFERVLGTRIFVFVGTAAGVSRRFVGIARASDVRSALRSKYPWLESALYKAYTNLPPPNFPFDDLPSWQATQLVESFLTDIQSAAGPSVPSDWTLLPSSQSIEHAAWVDDGLLQSLLGDKLNRASVVSSLPLQQRLHAVVRANGDYVASVNELFQLDGIIDRRATLEGIARRVVST